MRDSTGTAVLSAGLLAPPLAFAQTAARSKPALLGGTPVHAGGWPSWPHSDDREEAELIRVLKSGDWNRYRGGDQGAVATFERHWAEQVGTQFCQATNSGTSALVTALAALQIGPGDEVLVPPYTFVATVNSVLLHHALPVFVDSDPDTGLMDAEQLAPRINENTRAIMPVHIAGAPCDMDRILSIAKDRGLKVVEDACQAHTAAWRGQRVGSLGDIGCFSFQNSKNMTSGDGGALTTSDAMLFARSQAFHNNGNGRFDDDGAYTAHGCNLRLTEFQAAVLAGQLSRNDALALRREANAAHLNGLLDTIPGIRPKRTYPGTTRHGYHLYMFDFDPDKFAGMSKARLLAAIRAEGIPASGGYRALNKEPFVEQFLSSPGFQRIYSKERLAEYRERIECPRNDALIETTCWLTQNMLLGTRQDIEAIAAAIDRIRIHAAELVKA